MMVDLHADWIRINFIVVVLFFGANSASGGIWPGSTRLRKLKDANLNLTDLARKDGYVTATEYTVTTMDGYSLPLYRIPYGRYPVTNISENLKKPVVLLQHTILCSPNVFLLPGPENALAFLLADAGYDVWLGAFRGSSYANKHANRQTTSKVYYDFSWDEMGLFDYPAFIDKALEISEQKQLTVIGHSMGATAFFVMSSMKPEYAKSKVSFMISLAPLAFMEHISNPLFKILYGPFANNLKRMDITHIDTILVGKWVSLERLFQSPTSIIGSYFNNNERKLNMEVAYDSVGNLSAAASTKTLIHFKQLIKSGLFRRYDYGYEDNVLKYKQMTPPDYKLYLNQVPMLLCYSENDRVSQKQDFDKLHNGLSQGSASIEIFKVPHNNFTHMDFVFSKDAVIVVYNYVINRLNKNYEKTSS